MNDEHARALQDHDSSGVEDEQLRMDGTRDADMKVSFDNSNDDRSTASAAAAARIIDDGKGGEDYDGNGCEVNDASAKTRSNILKVIEDSDSSTSDWLAEAMRLNAFARKASRGPHFCRFIHV